MKVAFFHGLESSPKSEKNSALNREFDGVYAPPMDYKDPGLFERVLRDIKRDQPDLLIGSSMGGWFAYCISTLTGIPTLLFNPAFQGRTMEPEIRIGNKSSNHVIVFGKADDLIIPAATIDWISRNGIGDFDWYWESHGHRTPISSFTKWIKKMKSKLSENKINEEWSTEAPVGTDWSFLPEEVVQTLVPNFLAKRPPVGNLTVEDESEIEDVVLAQKGLTSDDNTWIRTADEVPYEAFYQWLYLRGVKVKMRELKTLWNTSEVRELCRKLKTAIGRPRPFQKFDFVKKSDFVNCDDPSFPSGHSCSAYYMATILSKKWPHLEEGLFLLASKIAKSRVQAGVHYPSDIKAGEVIGKALAMKTMNY